MPMFDQVTIVGVGLLGASLGLALKNRALARRVVGVGRPDSDSLKIAQERGAIDEGTADIAAAQACDLVVLCTPVGTFPDLMAQLAPHVRPNTIITDVGSTKRQVMEWASTHLRNKAPFVGSHPMAGSEKTGPAAASENLYDGAMCLMCTEPAFKQDAKYKLEANSPAASIYLAARKLDDLWRAVGMKTVWLPADEHDRVVATISHLPHAAAFALAATVGQHPESFIAAGGGYCDTTRIAGSDTTMWRDIFLTNRDAVLAAITALEGELAGLKHAIESSDPAQIEKRLANARQARQAVMAARGATR